MDSTINGRSNKSWSWLTLGTPSRSSNQKATCSIPIGCHDSIPIGWTFVDGSLIIVLCHHKGLWDALTFYWSLKLNSLSSSIWNFSYDMDLRLLTLTLSHYSRFIGESFGGDKFSEKLRSLTFWLTWNDEGWFSVAKITMDDNRNSNRVVIVYEARTPLGVGVLRCLTRVGVRHLYDIHTTSVEKVRQVSTNKWFFSLFQHFLNVSDTHRTLIQHVSDNLDKCLKKNFFFLCFNSNTPYTFF